MLILFLPFLNVGIHCNKRVSRLLTKNTTEEELGMCSVVLHESS